MFGEFALGLLAALAYVVGQLSLYEMLLEAARIEEQAALERKWGGAR